MCTVCDYNYVKMYGDQAWREAMAAGGQYSPHVVLKCQHTEKQRKQLQEQYRAYEERASREILP